MAISILLNQCECNETVEGFLVFQKADHLTSMEKLILLISFFTSLQYSDRNLTIFRNSCNLTICHSLKILSLFWYVDANNIVNNNFGHHDTIRILKIYRRKTIYPWWLYAAEERCRWVCPSLHPSIPLKFSHGQIMDKSKCRRFFCQ